MNATGVQTRNLGLELTTGVKRGVFKRVQLTESGLPVNTRVAWHPPVACGWHIHQLIESRIVCERTFLVDTIGVQGVTPLAISEVVLDHG